MKKDTPGNGHWGVDQELHVGDLDECVKDDCVLRRHSVWSYYDDRAG